jgi:histone acetyltransferase (RNA polymerase elongator complex component)
MLEFGHMVQPFVKIWRIQKDFPHNVVTEGHNRGSFFPQEKAFKLLLQSWPFLFVTRLQNLAQRNKITDHSRSSHCISECSHLMLVLSAMNFVATLNFLERICR